MQRLVSLILRGEEGKCDSVKIEPGVGLHRDTRLSPKLDSLRTRSIAGAASGAVLRPGF